MILFYSVIDSQSGGGTHGSGLVFFSFFFFSLSGVGTQIVGFRLFILLFTRGGTEFCLEQLRKSCINCSTIFSSEREKCVCLC